jgi:uncharacterized alpha-E superfamily protein
MLSRVADSIFWMNRYIERAENVARFIDVNLTLMLDLATGQPQQWEPLIVITGDLERFKAHYGQFTAENVIQFLTFDDTYPNSIRSCLRMARENARSIREIISSEMWEHVNAFYLMLQDTATQALSNPSQFFSEVKLASHLFAGIMAATMTHNEGWHFGQMGRYLERADKTSRLLDVKYFILLPSVGYVGSVLDEVQWMALLRSASAYEMYRKRGKHRITPMGVAEFLILDRDFPRSIQYCLLSAERSLQCITGTPPGTWQNPVERSLGRLRAELDYLTIEDVIQQGLHEFLDNLQTQMNTVDHKIFESFFSFQPLPDDQISASVQVMSA